MHDKSYFLPFKTFEIRSVVSVTRNHESHELLKTQHNSRLTSVKSAIASNKLFFDENVESKQNLLHTKSNENCVKYVQNASHHVKRESIAMPAIIQSKATNNCRI